MGSKKKIALFGLGGINWIGGTQYITNIVRAIHSLPESGDYEIHLLRGEGQQYAELASLAPIKVVFHDVNQYLPPWSFKNRLHWFIQRKFRKRVIPRMENHFIKEQFDLVYPLAASGCDGKLNSAAWIADFQYYHYPEGASKDFTDAAYAEISFIAKHANKIVLSSLACEVDCNTIFPETKGRTFSMPFTVYINEQVFTHSAFDALIAKYKVPGNFLVVSNSFCPTKNHKTIFRAMGLLRKQGVIVNLICTGNIVDQRNLHFANEILQSITEHEIRDQVFLLGIIPREDQLMFYRMSTAILQPSLNEGWSTSVEEAKALGKNLVVSDIAVHKEQCPDKRYMFSATDPGDLADKIKLLLEDNKGRCFPDLPAEKAAYNKYQSAVQAFGKRFTELIDA